MKSNEKVNVNSLILIREELVATIEQAANHLEAYVNDRANSQSLDSCVNALKQIKGSLQLIQLYGAVELADELLIAVSDICADDAVNSDEKLSELSRSFFILSRYFEYALQNQKGSPILLVPFINNILQAYRKPFIPESYFFEVELSYQHKQDSVDSEAGELVRRLRHMYQVGLLGVLRQTGVKPSLGLMKRAVSRLMKSTGDITFLWVVHAALIAFDEDEYLLTPTRKRAFRAFDQKLNQLEKTGVIESGDLLKEFVYFVAISTTDNKAVTAVKGAYNVLEYHHSELSLQREQQSLMGPSANTVSSVVLTLQEELRDVKEIIEAASLSDTSNINNHDELVMKMTNIKDILDVVGLKNASQTMKQQTDKIIQLKTSGEKADSVELLDIADAFLFVESTLKGLNKLEFTSNTIVEINKITRREMIVASNLAEAKQVVLDEVESGLAMVKRALSSFNDSDYDRAHIRNVPPTLNSIRGGMAVLEKPRAAAIVASCQLFIEGSLLPSSQPAALEQMLETFADALIGLEYYLDCMKIDNNVDDEILSIAEESLAALGYGVSHS